MKAKKLISLLLCVVLALCLGLATACDSCGGDEGPVKDKTALGNTTLTEKVKDPSKDVKITLVRGRNVLKTDTGSLSYDSALQAGDVIELNSDYAFIKVTLFDALGEQIVYSPSGRFTFQVPSTAAQVTYPKDTFGGTSHEFIAAPATDEEIAGERNLAVNVYDYMYIDEKNDAGADSLDKELDGSAAVASGQVATFPHAYANRVTRNEVGFYARNAIDGSTNSNGHGNYPYQSWGYNQKDDAVFTLYFGRKVKLSELGFVLRADFSGAKEHDTYWESATLEFSDGTTENVEFEKSGERQAVAADVVTEYVRIRSPKAFVNANSEMFAALTEIDAVGKETDDIEKVAVKTRIVPAFGGKERGKFTTKQYSYAEVKATMDRINKKFIDLTETTNYQIPDYNGVNMQVKLTDSGWKDAVYYSGLNEAFFTTGDMDAYYYLRGVGNMFSYRVNNGKYTPHGDNYQIGETYLQLADLTGGNYKRAHILGNAEFNLARDVNDKTPPSGLGLDTSRDWSHMGFWWCDALYMAMNSYTLLSMQTGDDKYVNAAYEGYSFWKSKLYNEKFDLWHRDSTQLNVYTNLTDEDGKVPTFWARGNAWVLAALAKQLLYLDPDKYPEIYAQYKEDFKKIAEALLEYQREDGTWNASIVDESYFGGKETTGTCGFIYGYCVGLELGILDPSVYFPVVSKAYDCVVTDCVKDDKLGYMQTTGYQPQNYRSEEYSKDLTHEFGMGLFLLASSGMMRICSDYAAPEVSLPADPQAALLG